MYSTLSSFLLVGAATAGAFLGGRLLRQVAAGSLHPSFASTSPFAASAQVAENGAAPGHGNAEGKSGTNTNGTSEATFETVYALVKEHYVDEVPADAVLTRGAVRALLQSLNDPNSQFLESGQRVLLENEAKGRFGGIGAVLAVRAQKNNGYTEYKLVVVAPLPGSPAESAGLRTGDIITHINGKWVLGYDPFLKASRMAQSPQARSGIGLFAAQMVCKGDPTTLAVQKTPAGRVTLIVQRSGGGSTGIPVSVALQETVVARGGVQSRPLGSGAGYIKISTLISDTPQAFQKAIAGLPHTNELVLDLRNNGGGLIQSAQAIEAALPIPPQTGATRKNPEPFGYEIQGSHRQTVPLTLPSSFIETTKNVSRLVVLVGGGTSGAAESLASALANRHGAVLVGQRTFGDAWVQTLYPLADGSAFTLTTGQWLSGRKISWAGRGLTPRFGLPQAAISATASQIEPNDPLLTQAVRLLQSPPTPPAPVRHAARNRSAAKEHRGL